MDGDFSVPAYYAHGRFQLALRRSDVERLAPRSATPRAEFLIRSIDRRDKGTVSSGVTPLSLSLSLAERLLARSLASFSGGSRFDRLVAAQSEILALER